MKIKAKITNYKYSVIKNYWYEIDNISDLRYLKKISNYIKLFDPSYISHIIIWHFNIMISK